ncbi:MAG: UDP-2,4-diacetamido-2,4,6-trideoxy-beta-L-altropyranose hydrolase [Lachnospiraceae bacterium]|nr:UDP-2,4-diacetamido-2,4,6-trideoxy-beta-L-altropyranose hydrolase [Lachnospiraceae bacterium]
MIVFRADGNSAVGAGHVMRLLSIADAARQAGENCIFVTASGDMEQVITARGYESHVLGTDYSDMESEDMQAVLEVYKPAVLFVDSYFVTEKYLDGLLEYCRIHDIRLVYMDDVLAFPYPCDILVNYNIYGREEDYLSLYTGRKVPRLLQGSAYAPLRGEFLDRSPRKVRKQADTVLVSTGGADFEHLAVELIKKAGQYPYTFQFVIGALNPDKEKIRELADASDNIVLYEQVPSLAPIMETCDVAISAAGSTLYELCATQTPTITYVLADNQLPGAQAFAAKGVMLNCGDVRVLGREALAGKLLDSAASLLEDYDNRVLISERMKEVVDGKGAGRILKEVLQEKA